MRLKVHLLDEMQNAPFAVKEYADQLPVEMVEDMAAADLVVGRKKSMFDKDALPSDKTYLLWTHEPFFDATPTYVVRNFFPERFRDRSLYVFNVYNGLVYTDNFYLAPQNGKLRNIAGEHDLNVPFDNKTISFAATYKLSSVIVRGVDLSLNTVRCELALALHKLNAISIIGRGWPDGHAESESRYVNRSRAKGEFLGTTNFNLCYENSCADYYTTEKLWESIFSGCLPIYFSNDTIYQHFPRESFVDGREFSSASALLEFVRAMTYEEYVRRVNLCRRAFNLAVQGRLREKSRTRTLRLLRDFLLELQAGRGRS